MNSSTTPTFPVAPGGYQQLSPFQTEKAKYFFRVNLDLENKGFVSWEDVEFYILFHMTVAGREDDAELEALLNERTKAAWNIILDNWPNSDRGRITLEQFLDTWASLVKFIESRGELPQWLTDWVAAGFKLYDLRGDGRIRPGAFHALYSKMGLRVMTSTTAYHALMDVVKGPLTLDAVMTLTKRLITSNDPNDLSGFLMPGFEVQLGPGPAEPLLRPGFGTEPTGRATVTNSGPPAAEETNMQPPKQEATEQPKIRPCKFSARSNEFQDLSSSSSVPRSKTSPQPAMETKASSPKAIPILSKQTGQRFASGSTTSPNTQQALGQSIGSEEAPHGNKHSFGVQDAKGPRTGRRYADQGDRGLICKILRDMNINPSECEILVDDCTGEIRPPDMFRGENGLAAEARWRPVVEMANGQVHERPSRQHTRPPPPQTQQPNMQSQYFFQHQFNPANIQVRHRIPGPRFPGSYHLGVPPQRAYSSIPSSLENIPGMTGNEFRGHGHHKFHVRSNFQQAVGPDYRPWAVRPPVDDAFVEEVVRKAAPLIQRMVRDEVKKYGGFGSQRRPVATMGNGAARNPVHGEQVQLQGRGEQRRTNLAEHIRPAFPRQPDEYEFNGSVRRANANEGISLGSGSSRTTRHQNSSPAAPPGKGRSPSMSPTAVNLESKGSDGDEFWRGQSGQSPSVNKMVFDRLLRRQQEMRAARKQNESGEIADAETDKSESDIHSKSKKTAGDGTEASDNTLEDEMLFIPGMGAYPPFMSMGVDASILQGSPMGGMGFAAPPFMMMGGPMFTAQPNDFSSDMGSAAPAMDGVFIVIDEKPDNVTSTSPSRTTGDAHL